MYLNSYIFSFIYVNIPSTFILSESKQDSLVHSRRPSRTPSKTSNPKLTTEDSTLSKWVVYLDVCGYLAFGVCLYMDPFPVYWRGHQVSPTVMSLKGRRSQKLQSNSTLSCEIVQIHSLFCHGFIKKPKSQFNRNKK